MTGAALAKFSAWIFLRAVTRAVMDAARAWAVAPLRNAHSAFGRNASGGWEVRSQRRYSLREILKLKLQFSRSVFARSLRVGLADNLTIHHDKTEGLMANLLHVVEVVHRAPPGASIHIDWKLRGNELGFKYGAVGDDVWGNLFRSLNGCPSGATHRAAGAIDLAFWGRGKDHLTGVSLRRHRRSYQRTISTWVEVTNPAVLQRVHDIRDTIFRDNFCLGVHRRVGNALVASLQKDGCIPSLDRLVARCDAILRRADRHGVIFLATDDAEAVDAFTTAFGSRLVIQRHSKRTTADKPEVHFADWRDLSLSDAEDVLVDTLLLSHCHVLLHGSSSISTVASLMNPELELVRIFGSD